MKQIITSLLDTDLYKFSQGQLFLHQFSDITTEWTFKCRSDVKFTIEMVNEIKRQIELYCSLSFSDDELQYLSSISWLTKDYIDFLSVWHPKIEHFIINTDNSCGLNIVTKGSQFLISYYEIPVLAIVNEVYFYYTHHLAYKQLLTSFRSRLHDKIESLETKEYCIGLFSEFGTRRRLSKDMQEYLIKTLSENFDLDTDQYSSFVGTSNVYFAKQFGIKAIGTMAHESVMIIGQGYPEFNPAYSNKRTMEAWHKEFGTELGIYLTDTITTDCFLKDFDKLNATLFSGVRHDSGNPFAWGNKIIDHYRSLDIDPCTKTLLFSDGLNFEKANIIYTYFNTRIKVAFGIGTYLSNDTFVEPLNIVMKVTECNNIPVCKLSDAEGKYMGKSDTYLEYLKRAIEWRINNEK